MSFRVAGKKFGYLAGMKKIKLKKANRHGPKTRKTYVINPIKIGYLLSDRDGGRPK